MSESTLVKMPHGWKSQVTAQLFCVSQRAMKPVKFEVNPMTMFRYFPREVARYPVVPEIKEILVVDGVEMEPVSYNLLSHEKI